MRLGIGSRCGSARSLRLTFHRNHLGYFNYLCIYSALFGTEHTALPRTLSIRVLELNAHKMRATPNKTYYPHWRKTWHQ